MVDRTSILSYGSGLFQGIICRPSTANTTGQLLILLFFFQSSFFLRIKHGLFLLFSFAFIFFSLIAHICFSLLENDLYFLICPRNWPFFSFASNCNFTLLLLINKHLHQNQQLTFYHNLPLSDKGNVMTLRL